MGEEKYLVVGPVPCTKERSLPDNKESERTACTFKEEGSCKEKERP